MKDLKLECSCGKVTGVVRDVEPGCGNRLVCYCKDCQHFADYFKNSENILNKCGGTEILQIHPSSIKIDHGFEYISCLKLSDKGLFRWFTSCCQTPIGNTVGLHIPFVGLIHSIIAPNQELDHKIGPIIGSLYVEHATGKISGELKIGKSKVALLFRVMRKVFVWKVSGKGSPNPFFDKNANPIAQPDSIHSQ
ncbi:MAG: hypothetical protein ACI9ES_002132 [Oceanospirillaceae bacterium]|jgi:hypothetical protein